MIVSVANEALMIESERFQFPQYKLIILWFSTTVGAIIVFVYIIMYTFDKKSHDEQTHHSHMRNRYIIEHELRYVFYMSYLHTWQLNGRGKSKVNVVSQNSTYHRKQNIHTHR